MQNSKDVASQAIPKAYRVFTLTSIMTISMGNAKNMVCAYTGAFFQLWGGWVEWLQCYKNYYIRNLWTNWDMRWDELGARVQFDCLRYQKRMVVLAQSSYVSKFLRPSAWVCESLVGWVINRSGRAWWDNYGDSRNSSSVVAYGCLSIQKIHFDVKHISSP